MRTFLLITVAATLHMCLASPPLEGFSRSVVNSANARGVPIPATGNASTKLYLFNGTNVVPGTAELLEFDVASKTFKTIMKNSDGQNDCLSASIVCGDTYYAVWTQFPAAAGVLKVDLKTGANKYLGTGAQGYIYHGLQCGANSSSLVGFASQMGTGRLGSLSFQLVHMDTTTGETTEVGDGLPKVDFLGYDGAFKFSPDGTELYAAFTGSLNPSSFYKGNLYIMDVATGKVKEHHKLPANGAHGAPYAIFPTGSDSFHLAFMSQEEVQVTMCEATKKSSGGGLLPPTVEVSGCKQINSLWAGSVPMPTCGGVLYSVKDNAGDQPGAVQPLTTFNFNSGETTSVVDLSTVIPGNKIGTVTCA